MKKCVLLVFLYVLISSFAIAQTTKAKEKTPDPAFGLNLPKNIYKDDDVYDLDTLRYAFHSQKVKVKLDTSSNLNLYKAIYEWLGTPYRFGGTSKSGIDCSSFTGKIYASAYKINLPRSSREMYNIVKQVPRAELKEGDLVFFRISRGQVSHVGIYLGDDRFAHASSSRGVMVSNLNEDYYKKYYYSGGRLVPKVEEEKGGE